MGSPIPAVPAADNFPDSEKKALFRSSMRGDWRKVVEIYKLYPESHRAKVTRTQDTALHIAISDGQEDVVEELIKVIVASNNPQEVMEIKNERNDTPLHVAASLGSVRMCMCIAEISEKLIGIRNQESETPFFLAALRGKKEAFLCLHSYCGEEQGYTYCRKSDGETILHCAINGDYFDLAFQITRLYKDLVNYVNQKGLSPLHLLARKPSAFRSGSHLDSFSNIIYHCIFVDELQEETFTFEEPLLQTDPEEKGLNYPKNYHTLVNFIRLLMTGIKILGRRSYYGSKKEDEEANRGAIKRRQLLPRNYQTCFDVFKVASKTLLVILGLGSSKIKRLHDKKEKHVWSLQVLDELLAHASTYEYDDNGRNPQHLPSPIKDGDTKPYHFLESGAIGLAPDNADKLHGSHPVDQKHNQHGGGQNNKEEKGENKNKQDKVEDPAKTETTILLAARNGVLEMVDKILQLSYIHIDIKLAADKVEDSAKTETPILLAARNGVLEMVDKILQLFPVAIHDINWEHKNVVLLAVENRQPHVYEYLLNNQIVRESVFHKVDCEGNSALHLAAMLGDHPPWLIPGSALQMQWEIKWYEYVKNSKRPHFFVPYNKKGKTPRSIFTEKHKELVENGGKWLTSTSQSCSVVAALIATVAFATSSTVPGGVKEDVGTPTLENEPAFNVFAISSLVALCFSVTALVMFLSILTSRYQEKDFGKDLPRKLLVGLTSLFVSIASMLISFCSGHFFVLKDKLKYAAFPIYALTCLPVTFFAAAQFPLYFDLIWATFKSLPQRSYKVMHF